MLHVLAPSLMYSLEAVHERERVKAILCGMIIRMMFGSVMCTQANQWIVL